MRTIADCIKELRTRKAWKSPEEIEKIFDEIADIDRANQQRFDNLLNGINDLKIRYERSSSLKNKNVTH